MKPKYDDDDRYFEFDHPQEYARIMRRERAIKFICELVGGVVFFVMLYFLTILIFCM